MSEFKNMNEKISEFGIKLYPIGDGLSSEERKFFGVRLNDVWAKDISAVRTSSRREPKKGEWYLSGAIPTAYKAPNDLSTEYVIAKLVKVESVMIHRIVEIGK